MTDHSLTADLLRQTTENATDLFAAGNPPSHGLRTFLGTAQHFTDRKLWSISDRPALASALCAAADLSRHANGMEEAEQRQTASLYDTFYEQALPYLEFSRVFRNHLRDGLQTWEQNLNIDEHEWLTCMYVLGHDPIDALQGAYDTLDRILDPDRLAFDGSAATFKRAALNNEKHYAPLAYDTLAIPVPAVKDDDFRYLKQGRAHAARMGHYNPTDDRIYLHRTRFDFDASRTLSQAQYKGVLSSAARVLQDSILHAQSAQRHFTIHHFTTMNRSLHFLAHETVHQHHIRTHYAACANPEHLNALHYTKQDMQITQATNTYCRNTDAEDYRYNALEALAITAMNDTQLQKRLDQPFL